MTAPALQRQGPLDHLHGGKPPAAGAPLRLYDLDAVPRTGLKGGGAPEMVAACGLPVPPRPNLCLQAASGALVARLGGTEMLVLDRDAAGSASAALDAAWAKARAEAQLRIGWPLPRQDSHCRLLLAGSAAAAVLAKVCAVDLDPARFAEGEVAQTTLAHVGAIIIRADRDGERAFEVLGDRASAEHIWGVLVDAGAEFGMSPGAG